MKTDIDASQSVLEAVDGIYAALKAASSVLSQGKHLGIEVAISASVAALIRQRHQDAECVLARIPVFERTDVVTATTDVTAFEDTLPESVDAILSNTNTKILF